MSPGYDRARVARALAGDRGELDVLVALLAPIVQVRVARALARRRDGRGRDLKQEAEDLRQEVFLALFADDGRWLRAWDETRGMSLVNWVGLVAERQVGAILRTGKRSPFTETATESEELDRARGADETFETALASRQAVARLVDELPQRLTPSGQRLFQHLVVDGRSVEETCAAEGLSQGAVYTWKSRFVRLCRELLGSEPAKGDAS